MTVKEMSSLWQHGEPFSPIEKCKGIAVVADQFKAGDVVMLKSGGETMTISWVEEQAAYCEWFDKGAVKGHKFQLVQLEKV